MSGYPLRPLPSRRTFLKRLARGAALALTLLTVGLGIGILGYHYIARLSWIDALMSTSMLLAGEGPVGVMRTGAAKLFASFYALFGGILFLTIAGVLLAPAIHRFLHRFHLETSKPLEPGDAGRKGISPSDGEP